MQHKYLIHRFLCYDSQHYKNDLEIKTEQFTNSIFSWENNADFSIKANLGLCVKDIHPYSPFSAPILFPMIHCGFN